MVGLPEATRQAPHPWVTRATTPNSCLPAACCLSEQSRRWTGADCHAASDSARPLLRTDGPVWRWPSGAGVPGAVPCARSGRLPGRWRERGERVRVGSTDHSFEGGHSHVPSSVAGVLVYLYFPLRVQGCLGRDSWGRVGWRQPSSFATCIFPSGLFDVLPKARPAPIPVSELLASTPGPACGAPSRTIFPKKLESGMMTAQRPSEQGAERSR